MQSATAPRLLIHPRRVSHDSRVRCDNDDDCRRSNIFPGGKSMRGEKRDTRGLALEIILFALCESKLILLIVV